jgi:hypothetical protein
LIFVVFGVSTDVIITKVERKTKGSSKPFLIAYIGCVPMLIASIIKDAWTLKLQLTIFKYKNINRESIRDTTL